MVYSGFTPKRCIIKSSQKSILFPAGWNFVFYLTNLARQKMQPRPASVAGPIPASAYVLECKMLRAYDRLLRAADLDSLIAACFGERLSASKAAAADERLQYAMPELLQKLKPEQQAPFAEWLLGEAPDLPAAVRELIRLENALHRPQPLNTKEDNWRVKAAGMGKCRAPLKGDAIRRHQEGKAMQRHLQQKAVEAPKLGPPLVLEPLIPAKVTLRTKKRGRRKPLLVSQWQYAIWPPVSGGMSLVGGL
jgi:hypothetical protein